MEALLTELVIGATASVELLADSTDLVPAFGRRFPTWYNLPPVVASMVVIGLMEEACVRIVQAALPLNQTTLGASIDFAHLAPTPQGLLLRASATLVDIHRNKLTFQATCHDDLELIGEMRHVRAIVELDPFYGRIESKRDSVRPSET